MYFSALRSLPILQHDRPIVQHFWGYFVFSHDSNCDPARNQYTEPNFGGAKPSKANQGLLRQSRDAAAQVSALEGWHLAPET